MRWVDFKDSVKRFWEDFKHQKSGMFGLFFLIVLIVLAIAAPYITSPNIPKEWQTGTAWVTNPKNAPPAWENYFVSEKRASQVEYTIDDLHLSKTQNGSYTVYTMTFTYDMRYDIPPKDIVITGLNSTAKRPQDNPLVTMYVERPKENGLKYNSLMLLYNVQLPSSGVVQLAYTQEVKSLIFYWLYENGIFTLPMQLPDSLPMDMKMMYLTQQVQMNSTLYGYYQSMDPMKVIFGKMTDNGKLRTLDQIVNSPEALQGTYKFTIVVTVPSNVQVDFSNFKVALVGRTYGLLGTDQYGRPIAVGLLWGIRVALAIGIAVSVSTVLIGILVGVTSAYLGGWADEAIQRFTEFMMTLPVLPMLILLSLYFGGKINLKQLVFILVLFGWMGTTKVARSMALQIKEQTYVEAARALGASTGRIVFKHIVPQLLPYAFASIALSVPGAILSEAGLSFLGLTSNNMITWGQMLNAANANGATLNGYWWQVIPPGLAIAFVGLIFVLIGVSLDTVLNPRLKRA
ncbi:ABC transporter permease [Thermococcus sp. 9N3]|uniref:ABC transporter permease n=1 Tax=Thermococcus sp. 9N3 TaxID=163002 RepID=UPI00142F87FD|nr:ABC transporter permease [Thermococcus sp. 9N3]NJE49477.1 ABC transporter permease [Thermococcus sp. 9N3]